VAGKVLMVMKTDKSKEAIEELMEKAAFHADESLHVGFRVSPTLYIRCQDGTTTGYTLGNMINDKEALVKNTRLMCVAHGAEATVLCAEASMQPNLKHKAVDFAQSAERQEVVVLLGESREQSFQRVLPILRMDDGAYFRFGQMSDIHGAKLDSLVGNLLSEDLPTEQKQLEAKSLLEARGMFPINGKRRGQELGIAWF
jgi:hypothetical protein